MSRTRNRKIEILAPAGSYEGMKAAMNAGCDAVYIGGKSFGARAFANNPDEETMLKAIDEAHIRGKSLYLTVNTLVKEHELRDRLYTFLEKFYLQGLDAVIVQDVGVMNFIHRHFPNLPIHASTQTTITMAQGANLLKDLGVTRLVTPRELSFGEIKHIRDNSDLEIETFVHGALCYCYSGQCLMSSMLGGRSGNRGRCAQPCRMAYEFYSGDKKVSSTRQKYLLSPKDINMLSLIPQLIEAGVDSFKIEGRMKRPEYGALVSSIYRRYVDYYLEHGEDKYNQLINSDEYEKDMIDLMDIYNRGGFSEGYGKMYNGKSMMAMNRPNHSGVYVGEICGKNNRQIEITFTEDVNAQDVIEIRDKEGEPVYEFTLKDSSNKGETLWANAGRKLGEIKIGDLVYRTRNNKLLNQIASDYIQKDETQGITGHIRAKLGKKLKLSLNYKGITSTVYQDEVQSAKNQPMTKGKIKEQISKMGDTPYYLDNLEIDIDKDIFIPVGWLNKIRRDGVQLLQEKVIEGYNREKNDMEHFQKEEYRDEVKAQGDFNIGMSASIQTKEQFYGALDFEEVTSIHALYDRFTLNELLDMAKESASANKKFYISLPHISRRSIYKRMEEDISSFIQDKYITGFVVKNLEEIALLKNQKDIILNHNMYIFNNEARDFYNSLGLKHFTAPLELNYKELQDLDIQDCDIMVYGHLPLMVSAQCLYKSTDGCNRCNIEDNRTDYLVDRLGEKFYVQSECSGCYNTILNGKSLSLLNHLDDVKSLNPRNIRLDFTMENKAEVITVIKDFIDTLYKGRDIKDSNQDNYTAGHFRRGID